MVEVGLWGCHERTATNGGGASAGETVLIDSEEPPSRRSKSLVDPLLDFSPSRSSLFIPASASAFYERVLAISVTCAPPFPSPFQTSSTAIIPFAPKPSSSWPFYFHPSYPSLSLSLPLSLSLSPLPLLLFQTDPFTVSPSVQSIHRRASQSIWAALGQCLPAIKK